MNTKKKIDLETVTKCITRKWEYIETFTLTANETEAQKETIFNMRFSMGCIVRNAETDEEVTTETWRRAEGYDKTVEGAPHYDARADIEEGKASIERKAEESIRRHEEEQQFLETDK